MWVSGQPRWRHLFPHFMSASILAVAGVLASQATRPLDVAVRWGGEEFVVVWYDVTRDNVQKLAKQVRSRLKACASATRSATANS